MANGESQLNTDYATFMQNFNNLLAVAKELNARYTDIAQADVNALATNGTILGGTQLTKLQWQQAFGITTDFVAFAENGAAAQSWRRPIAYQVANAGKA